MSTKRDVNNPWSNKSSSANSTSSNSKSKKNVATSVSQKSKHKSQPDQKFKEARQKHEEYAKKHNILEYDSSSDEDLETGSVLGILSVTWLVA